MGVELKVCKDCGERLTVKQVRNGQEFCSKCLMNSVIDSVEDILRDGKVVY